MHENFKLPLTRLKRKIEFGTVSEIDQYRYACHHAKFGAFIKNRTIQELCRRTMICCLILSSFLSPSLSLFILLLENYARL